jgi:hypothetical protein
MEDAGGIPWVFMHLGWVVLGVALIYGIAHSRRLSSRQKAMQQEKVRENFRQDEDAA